MVATTYEVLCDFKFAEEARNHLAKLALKGEVNPRLPEYPAQQQPVQQQSMHRPTD